MKFYSCKTVQRGSELKDIDSVRARLREIKEKRHSTYHDALHDGRLQVLYDPNRQTRGRYDIVVMNTIDPPEGMIVCPNCEQPFFDLDDDYLCPPCRKEMDEV